MLLEDRVLSRQINRPAHYQAVIQRRTRKIVDGLVDVIHRHEHARTVGLVDLMFDLFAVLANEFHR